MSEEMVSTEQLEPADVFKLCNKAWREMDVALQLAVTKNLNTLMASAMAAVLAKSGEDIARPLGLAVNMVKSMFQVTDRIVVLRRGEACLRFNQPGQLVNADGTAKIEIEFIGPRPGRGEAAKHMAKTALELLQNAGRGSLSTSDISKLM